MNERISTTELADILARKAGLSQEEAFAFVRDVFDCIDRAISADKYVKVKGLGTFKLISMSPRESVAVNTGERIVIEGYQKFSFTPEAALKDLINKPFAHFEAVTLNEGIEFNDTEVDFKAAEGDEDSSTDTEELNVVDTDDSPTELVPRPVSAEEFYSSVEVISVAPPTTNPVNSMAARKKTTIFSVPVVDKTVPLDVNVQPESLVADKEPLKEEKIADGIPSKQKVEVPASSSSMGEEQEEDPKERLKKERSRAAAELLARLKAKQQLQKEEEMNRVRPLGRKKPESLSETTEAQKELVERLSNSDTASRSDTAKSLSQRIEGKQQEKKSSESTIAASKAASHWAEAISLRSGRPEAVEKVESIEAEEPKKYSGEIIKTEILSSEKGTPEGLKRAKERRERTEASLRASRKTYRFPFFIMTVVLLLVLFMISFVYITHPVWLQDIMGTKEQQIIIKLADQQEASVPPRKTVAQSVQTQKTKESKPESTVVPEKSDAPDAPPAEKAVAVVAQTNDKLWITEAHVNPKDYKIVGTLESITLTRGMSLARLAKKYYGCRDLWTLILAHNSTAIKNADNIPLGMTLKIPKLMKK